MIRTTLLVTAMLAAWQCAAVGAPLSLYSTGRVHSVGSIYSITATSADAENDSATSTIARPKSKVKRKKTASHPKTLKAVKANAPTPSSAKSVAATASEPSSTQNSFIAPPTSSSPNALTPAAPPKDSMITPVMAQNATASASPIRSTTPAPADADEKSAARFRPKTKVKARIDDGRYRGFHQDGGDQPAGDQQLRSADRIQTENKRLSRESSERAPPAQGGSTPALRDQSTIIKTQ